MPRYLTKSRFGLGCQCETKLFYAGKKKEYVDLTLDDPFLSGLAEGGFQVGALARYWLCDNPETDIILSPDHEEALLETQRRLKSTHATIAEAAFQSEIFFIRADVVSKKGTTIQLYEVKSSSWDDDESFWQKRDPSKLDSGWKPYLLDVAFQKYVVTKACPDMRVEAFLVLVDKGKQATVDGLNQLFKVAKRDGRARVRTTGIVRDQLGAGILRIINVDADIHKTWNLTFPMVGAKDEVMFEQLVQGLGSICESGQQVFSGIGRRCKDCEFRFSSDLTERQTQQASGLKSGREECWQKALGERFDPEKPTVLEIWNCRSIEDFMQQKKCYLEDISESDLGGGKSAGRQWLQVKKAQQHDTTPWIDLEQLSEEIKKWIFPLHMIDFETSRVAIPFNKGRRPYEQIAFQFSHHTIGRNGGISHAGQWLEASPGRFPNFDFVRALKKELKEDDGTIFCYASHENTVLNEISDQLQASAEPDRNDLRSWIQTITRRKVGKKDEIKGPRCMVDMRDLVLRGHYDPYTHGSNSLKEVLPAIIHSSAWLRDRYGQAVYGSQAMPSHNYRNWKWIQPEQGNDPYKTLPPLFTEEEQAALSEYLEVLQEVREGGEAMMAYAKLQFVDIPPEERKRISDGLLRYCELDTLAMVMLYEYWHQECESQ